MHIVYTLYTRLLLCYILQAMPLILGSCRGKENQHINVIIFNTFASAECSALKNTLVHLQFHNLFHTRAPGQLYPCIGHFYKCYLNGSPNAIGDCMSKVIHALAGCDTTTTFNGKNKRLSWQV